MKGSQDEEKILPGLLVCTFETTSNLNVEYMVLGMLVKFLPDVSAARKTAHHVQFILR